MHSLTRRLIVAVAASLMIAGSASAQATPVGKWNTISDKDGKPEAVVEIRDVNGELVGTVTELLVEADPADTVCGKCSDERKGQPIVGMGILRPLEPAATAR